MMKRILLGVLASAMFVGCATYNAPRTYWQPEESTTTVDAQAEDSAIRVGVVSETDMDFAQVTIENVSDGPVTILWDKSSYSYSDGDSSRIVTGDTRRMDVNRSQPPLTIGPENSTREAIVAVKAVESERIHPWIEERGEFLIAYEHSDTSRFLSVPFDSVETKGGDEVLGQIWVSQIRWHPLFIGFPERIRSSLRQQAESKATDQYGDGTELVGQQFSSEWHPLSLLIGFSMYGWVENASLRATVVPSATEE